MVFLYLLFIKKIIKFFCSKFVGVAEFVATRIFIFFVLKIFLEIIDFIFIFKKLNFFNIFKLISYIMSKINFKK